MINLYSSQDIDDDSDDDDDDDDDDDHNFSDDSDDEENENLDYDVNDMQKILQFISHISANQLFAFFSFSFYC